MKTFAVVSVTLLVIVLSACSNEDTYTSHVPRMEKVMSGAPVSDSSRGVESYSETSSNAKIQINGNLTIEVQNVSVALEEIRILINQHGGSITSSNLDGSFNRYANLSALVPRGLFYELIEEIEKIATEVTNEHVNSFDVTEEFVDIEARLNVMKQTENRFIALLSEAADVEQIMSVERELMRLRGGIDSLEGRLQYLSKTTDNAVLNIHITEERPITGNDWSALDSLDNSVRSLISLSKHIANFLISVMVFSPILIGGGLISFFGYRIGKRYLYRRRR
jgi:hypothetical protein